METCTVPRCQRFRNGTAGPRAGRTSLATALLLILAFALLPAPAAAQAPAVDWRNVFWFGLDQFGMGQGQNASGADWWYDHKTSQGMSGSDGFICAGFSSIVNWSIDESTMGGCLNSYDPDVHCDDFEGPSNKIGTALSVLALIDPTGTSTIWKKRFNQWAFYRVIQAADGGFVAIGYTSSTRDPFTTTPLYYNPNQESGEVTDQFDDGVACTFGNNVQHISVVKVNHSGVTQWQYIYGMASYRDMTGAPIPAVAYANLAEGYGLTQTPDGGYLLTGNAFDPALNLRRTCLIKIDGSGMWEWGSFYGPTDQSSTGQSVTTYGTGSGLRYVVSGTEFFPGTAPNPYIFGNPMLFQRACVMQFDGSVSGAPATYQWMDNSFDINYTQSQSTYDVQIAQDGAGSILFPMVANCQNCLYSGDNIGEAKVYRLDPATGAVTGSISFGQVHAYDLKVRVCPLVDGGYGVISTKRLVCAPEHDSCFNESYWGTDAYVARVNSCDAIIWESLYDDGTVSTAPFPYNQKLQECMYSISQADDGGFVVSGNSSPNFDDSYLLKLDPENTLPDGLYMQDTPSDVGIEINPDTGPMWISNDIWVRTTQDDAQFSHANQHQNPEYTAGLSDSNYIYVRVRHRGCSTTPDIGELKVYTAAASTGLTWPGSWTTGLATTGGDIILGEVTSTMSPINVSLAGNTDQIFQIPWFPPSGVDVPGGHVCILARVVTPAGFSHAEISSIGANVRNNNDIIWKNVTVVDLLPGSPVSHHIGVHNVYTATNGLLQLTFLSPTEEDAGLFDHATVIVDLGSDLARIWKVGGFQGSDITNIDDRRVRIDGPGAYIGNLNCAADQAFDVIVTFERPDADLADRTIYNLDMIQTSHPPGAALFERIGGERYVVHMRSSDAEPRRTKGGVGDDPKGAARALPAGTLVMESVPNPMSGRTDINCTIPAAGVARLVLYDQTGREVRTILNERREAGRFSVRADLGDLPSGSYTVKLTVDGMMKTIPVVLRK